MRSTDMEGRASAVSVDIEATCIGVRSPRPEILGLGAPSRMMRDQRPGRAWHTESGRGLGGWPGWGGQDVKSGTK